MKDRLCFSAAVTFATIAFAGLMLSSMTDLKNLVAIPIPSAMLIPGIILIGALLTVVVGDVGRASIALLMATVLGATLFALAIAAPGFAVEEVQVRLVDRGTTYGLLALMLFGLFGMSGMVVAWLLESFVGPRTEGGGMGDGRYSRAMPPLPARSTSQPATPPRRYPGTQPDSEDS